MVSANKKIKNATETRYCGINFKSKLEVTTYKELKIAGFEPLYEPIKYTLIEGFRPTVLFYDKDKKTGLIKQNNKYILPITYTPDFIVEKHGITFIIEAKGMQNDTFPLKKKLFRRYLEAQQEPAIYFEVHNKKQILEMIKIIKSYDKRHID